MDHTRLRRLIAPLLAGSVVFASAGVAAADEPGDYTLDAASCLVFDAEGNDVDAVPPGSTMTIIEGWFAKTRGQSQSFANNATWVLELNGTQVDLLPYLSGLIDLRPFGWAQFFAYPGGTLGVGQELHTHYDNILKSANFDGRTHYKQGSVFGGGVDCTVTVANP
jgi:hypothetical protein